MSITRHSITDHKGRTLVTGPIYSNPNDPFAPTQDEGHLVGYACYGTWYTIDGEPANKRRASQFIRRARRHMEKKEGE